MIVASAIVAIALAGALTTWTVAGSQAAHAYDLNAAGNLVLSELERAKVAGVQEGSASSNNLPAGTLQSGGGSAVWTGAWVPNGVGGSGSWTAGATGGYTRAGIFTPVANETHFRLSATITDTGIDAAPSPYAFRVGSRRTVLVTVRLARDNSVVATGATVLTVGGM